MGTPLPNNMELTKSGQNPSFARSAWAPWTPRTKFGLSYRRKQKDDISFCKVPWNNNLDREATKQQCGLRKKHPASSPTEQHLNLRDEIPVRGVDCNKPGFWRSQKYELFKNFGPMCEACSCWVKLRTIYK